MRRAPIFATADAVEEAFYDSMQRGDLDGMMSLWADDDEVVCVHPNGPRLVGIESVRAAWAQILSGGGMDVRPTDVRVYQGAMLEVHNLVEKVVIKSAGGIGVVECAATNVYLKSPEGWRMVLHQSGTSDRDDPPESSGNDTLH